ncbi:DUF1937 domain-containing protein [Rhizorhabdus dicambivorans]|uniref:DUF1937 family protein n=1 Tax=Rhizorhabdus dicambivorans TaxID=1850238 RepID=UPI00082F96C1|nr:DUF1937 family protein [Rhizorhabdus dicambivorans]ATE64006.1 DUF1937 domain-containing protein [Rhizorhabdus dicambivorans]
MIYLSAPYSSSDPAIRAQRVASAIQAMTTLMAKGRVTICPIVLNHQAIEQLPDGAAQLPGAYWKELELRLADACDQLLVLRLPGWDKSRGVKREMDLFNARAKPVEFLDPLDGSIIAGANLTTGRRSELSGE